VSVDCIQSRHGFCITLDPELFPEVSTTALCARIPMQFLFLAWTDWATRPGVSWDTELNE